MSFFSTVPISEPVRDQFVKDKDLGAFGWDNDRGLFVIVDEELDMTILPYPGAIEQTRRS